MAYTPLPRSATIRVDGTADSPADHPAVPSGATFLDLSTGKILRKTALGEVDDAFSARSAISREKLIASVGNWRVLASSDTGVGLTTGTLAANLIRAVPFEQLERHTYTDFAAFVSSGAAAAARMRLYLFSHNRANGLPGEVLLSSPDLEVTANNLAYGFQPVSGLTLEPGVYWACFHVSSRLSFRVLTWATLRTVRGFASPAVTTQVSRVDAPLAFDNGAPATWPSGSVQVNGSGQNVPAMFVKSSIT